MCGSLSKFSSPTARPFSPPAIRIKQKTQARRLRFLLGRDEGARTHDLTDVDRALWPTELRLRIYLEYFSIISFYCQRLSPIFSFFIAFSDFFLFFGGYNTWFGFLYIICFLRRWILKADCFYNLIRQKLVNFTPENTVKLVSLSLKKCLKLVSNRWQKIKKLVKLLVLQNFHNKKRLFKGRKNLSKQSFSYIFATYFKAKRR